jgi:RNA polymerase sigma-70 factor (ECF subfamily)
MSQPTHTNPPLSALADPALVQQVAQGDRQAFLQLYDRHSARVYGLALRMLGDVPSAEEVTQDAFMKLWTRAQSYSAARGTLVAWLLTIARHSALDRIRLEARRPAFSGALSIEREDGRPSLTAPESATEEARWRSLRFALAELPAEQRQVIELAYYHGVTHSQMAEMLALPLGTVKTRLRLGMERLREAWIEEKPAGQRSKRLKGDVKKNRVGSDEI